MKLKGIGYASAAFAITGIEVFLRLYLGLHYVEQVGMDPLLVGWAFGISLFIDSILKPAIGRFIDKNKSIRGEHYSFLFPALISTCISLGLLMNPPIWSHEVADFSYLLALSIMFNLSFSFLTISYLVSVVDIADSSSERIRLIGFRYAIGNLGTFLGLGIPGYFLLLESKNAFKWATLTLMSILFVTVLVSYFTLKGNNKLGTRNTAGNFKIKSLVGDLKLPFLYYFLLAQLCIHSGFALGTSLIFYFCQLRLKMNAEQIQIILGIFLISITMFVPFWIFLSKKFRILKLSAFSLFILGLNNLLVFAILPDHDFFSAIIVIAVIPGCFFSANFLMDVYFTDFILDIERKFNTTKLGFYFGVFKIVPVLSIGIALLLTGKLLSWSSGQIFDVAASYDKLDIIVGPVIGVFFLFGAAILYILSLERKQIVVPTKGVV